MQANAGATGIDTANDVSRLHAEATASFRRIFAILSGADA